MFDKIIGFIGAGNMGSAMIGGILNASLVTTSQVIASAASPATLERIRTRFSIETTPANETVAERSDILILAVKPQKFEEIIPKIAPRIKHGCIVVSIAAGKTLQKDLTVEEIKKLLPQYSVARKPAPLTGNNRTMLDGKKAEFAQLCQE